MRPKIHFWAGVSEVVRLKGCPIPLLEFFGSWYKLLQIYSSIIHLKPFVLDLPLLMQDLPRELMMQVS